jgi:SAM-dependent methyltransferase
MCLTSISNQFVKSPLFFKNMPDNIHPISPARQCAPKQARLNCLKAPQEGATNKQGLNMEKKQLLNVGCGPLGRAHGFTGFEEWQEVRLDIDASVQPDVIGTMTDMSAVPSGSIDAIVSSHNIEHLYPHEVPLALAEFVRVLKPDGLVLITCPDLQSVCAQVAKGALASPLYESPAGPISALDILYGHRGAMAAGNLYMAHRCGFTIQLLADTLQACGFVKSVGRARPDHYDLYLLAAKQAIPDEAIRNLAARHLPL